MYDSVDDCCAGRNAGRGWLRFHLLTLVLMTLAAGGIMWFNVRDAVVPFPKTGTVAMVIDLARPLNTNPLSLLVEF